MIETDIYLHLTNDENIISLVGDRIFPMIAPTGTVTPYITYQMISDVDLTSVQGENYGNKTRFQIDIFGKKYLEVKAVKGAVKDAMYNFNLPIYDFISRDLFEGDTELKRQLIEFKISN